MAQLLSLFFKKFVENGNSDNIIYELPEDPVSPEGGDGYTSQCKEFFIFKGIKGPHEARYGFIKKIAFLL